MTQSYDLNATFTILNIYRTFNMCSTSSFSHM
jgi:hypothetical protein